jgi:hypothetical protein
MAVGTYASPYADTPYADPPTRFSPPGSLVDSVAFVH